MRKLLALIVILFLSADHLSAAIAIANGGAAHAIGKDQLGGGDANTNSTPINTTGATLIIVVMTSYLVSPGIGDSASNTWTCLTQYANVGSVKICYVENPATSGTHTFATSGGSYASIAVVALTGTLTASSLRDSTGSTATGTTVSPGTSGASTDFVFAAVSGNFYIASSVNNGFTILDSVANTAPGSNLSLTTAYKLATGAETPTFTMTNSDTLASDIAAFKESGGGSASVGCVTPFCGIIGE